MRIQGTSGTITTANGERIAVGSWSIDVVQGGLTSWFGTAIATYDRFIELGRASITFQEHAGSELIRWTGAVNINREQPRVRDTVVTFQGSHALFRDGEPV